MLARWAQTHRPGLPVLLTSGFSGNMRRTHETPYHGPMLDKPYDLTIALEHIGQLLNAAKS